MRFTGQVVKGQGFATLIFGLPTANLEFDEAITLGAGVYSGYTTVGQDRYPSVIYIGPQGSEKFEAHLFGFSGQLYGQTLDIEILKLVSQHVAWEDEDQMKTKVLKDVQLAREYFGL